MRPGSRARLAALAVAVLGAVAVFAWARSLGVPAHGALVLACGPLMCPGLPAALLLWAGRGGRDPYDVRPRAYPPPLNPEQSPKSVTPHR